MPYDATLRTWSPLAKSELSNFGPRQERSPGIHARRNVRVEKGRNCQCSRALAESVFLRILPGGSLNWILTSRRDEHARFFVINVGRGYPVPLDLQSTDAIVDGTNGDTRLGRRLVFRPELGA